MKWTAKQQQSIDSRNKNLLVSAAAGSGKTAVLVERIKKLILEEHIPIDKFLVVTFTNAAASEMREKLVKAIKEQIKVDRENEAFLKAQLNNIYKADISTFHKFAIRVIRENFSYLGIDPNLAILDEAQGQVMKSEAMDEVFASCYENMDDEIKAFFDAYVGSQSDDDLKNTLIKNYEKLMSIPDPFEWLDRAVDFLALTPEELEDSAFAKEIVLYCKTMLSEAVDYMERAQGHLEAHGLELLAKKNKADTDELIALADSKSLRDLNLMTLYKHTQMRATKAESEEWAIVKELASNYRSAAKKIVDELVLMFFNGGIESRFEEQGKTYVHAKAFRRIITQLHKTYAGMKEEKKVMDFNDLEHFSYQILKEDTLAQAYREKYEFIFIDEYQDSNYIQEAIVAAVKRENNLFTVGDIKQSIYRFRMAEPDIFKARYAKYRKETDINEKIDLNENFRSKKPIVDAINYIFSTLMDDYDDGAALHQGAPSEKDINTIPEFVVINQDYDEEDLDEDLLKMKKEELEALAVCDIIDECLGKDFYDTKADVVRPIELRDIVILGRSVKTLGPVFRDVLAEKGHGVFIADSRGYFDNVEVMTFINLLKVIDNSRRDLPLLSVLRSAIFGFTIEELVEIRMAENERGIPFYKAFRDYGEKDDYLALKVKKTLDRLAKWKQEVVYNSIDEFLWKLLEETGYYAYLGALPGGVQRQANIRTLVDKAAAIDEKGGAKIYDFIKYIDSLKDKDVEIGQVSVLGEDDDVVRIMTIHKSKGLEFPVVIISGLGVGTNKKSNTSVCAIDKDYGIGFKYVNRQERWKRNTILQNLIISKDKRAELEESIRVLYVALTRAKDRLYMTGTTKNYLSEKEKLLLGKSSMNSYYEMLLPSLASDERQEFIKVKVLNRANLAPSNVAPSYMRSNPFKRIEEYKVDRNADLMNEIDRVLSYQYPFADDIEKKSKYTVSELNKEEGSNPSIKLPAFYMEDGGKELEKETFGARLGTAIHNIFKRMEFAVLKEAVEKGEGEAYVASVYADMEDMHIMTEGEEHAIKFRWFTMFAQNEMFERIVKAKKAEKERTFNYLYDFEGTEVMVQGIIDLFFEEEDGLVLIDYKSNIHTENIEDIYRTQMNVYREALENITGKKVKETYLYLVRTGDYVEIKE